MTSIFCQMVSVQIWTQPALLSKWSMSSLQSVPFLPSGDLSKISGMDNLLHSWHQGVNDYHYNIVLCSASWEQTKYAVTVSSLPNGTPSAHTVTYSTLHSTQPKDHILQNILFESLFTYKKTFIRSSVSFWGKLFRICKVAIFPLILSSHLTESFINPLISQVLRGSKYNERKMVFYMTYPGAGDARVVPTYVPFPSRE